MLKYKYILKWINNMNTTHNLYNVFYGFSVRNINSYKRNNILNIHNNAFVVIST